MGNLNLEYKNSFQLDLKFLGMRLTQGSLSLGIKINCLLVFFPPSSNLYEDAQCLLCHIRKISLFSTRINFLKKIPRKHFHDKTFYYEELFLSVALFKVAYETEFHPSFILWLSQFSAGSSLPRSTFHSFILTPFFLLCNQGNLADIRAIRSIKFTTKCNYKWH